MKKQLIRAAATTVLGLSLTTGFAAADISGTGTSSHNTVKTKTNNTAQVTNSNKLGASNDNYQTAKSGSASVKHNTTGGDATTGDTSNDNEFDVTATVDNSATAGGLNMAPDAAPAGDISDTGTNSSNSIDSSTTNKLTVKNTNDISVKNNNKQSASSGNASVDGNTTGGDATSGGASNTSSSTVDLEVTN